MRNAVYQLFLGNLSSKLVGFIREILTAALFGTGQVIAAYRISLLGILSPINFLTSDILNTAFVPKYKVLLAKDENEAQSLFYVLLALFSIFSILLIVLLNYFAFQWLHLMAPDLDHSTMDLTVKMFHIITVAVPFYLISAIFLFLCMARSDFVPMAIRPLIQNVGMIIGALFTYWTANLMFLAWGFTLAYVFFSIWVVYRSYKQGFLKLPSLFKWLSIKETTYSFWLTLRPLVFLPFLLQGNIVIERMVASLISIAAISALDYAKFVTETMILMVSTPLAFAGLTHWSGLTFNEMKNKIDRMFSFLCLVSIPVSAFLVSNAYEVVEFIYSRGKFNSDSVKVTGDIMYGISWGLWAQVIAYVLIKSLSAQMRNKEVMFISMAALVLNVIFNLLFYKLLGAKALGFANSAYAFMLLILSLNSLSLIREFVVKSWLVLFGAGIYMLTTNYISFEASVILNLTISSLYALIFWLTWCFLFPSLRSALLDIKKLKS